MHQVDPERNARQAWTDADLERFRELLAEKVPVREIADILGRTEYAVRSKASQARISLRAEESHGGLMRSRFDQRGSRATSDAVR